MTERKRPNIPSHNTSFPGFICSISRGLIRRAMFGPTPKSKEARATLFQRKPLPSRTFIRARRRTTMILRILN